MTDNLDAFDLKILDTLQNEADISMDSLAEKTTLSRNACWRRMKRMETDGVIKGRAVLLDPKRLGCALTAIVMIRASAHAEDWLGKFDRAVQLMPDIVGAYRMTGDLDYLLKVRVADVAAYDRFYKDLIARVPLLDISASFVMEEIKDTVALPLPTSA